MLMMPELTRFHREKHLTGHTPWDPTDLAMRDYVSLIYFLSFFAGHYLYFSVLLSSLSLSLCLSLPLPLPNTSVCKHFADWVIVERKSNFSMVIWIYYLP